MAKIAASSTRSSSRSRAPPRLAAKAVLRRGRDLLGDCVEDAVDEAGRIVFVEGLGDIDIFTDDHGRRNIAAAQEFERRGAEDGAQRRVDPPHRPVARERLVDRGVDVELGA